MLAPGANELSPLLMPSASALERDSVIDSTKDKQLAFKENRLSQVVENIDNPQQVNQNLKNSG